jgi:hypothetical protein
MFLPFEGGSFSDSLAVGVALGFGVETSAPTLAAPPMLPPVAD